uniref:Uncharacterized protein n=1 Tax=viral metagenome TaxID=1070528 RepID=A0A6C0DNM7_9ZZZZ
MVFCLCFLFEKLNKELFGLLDRKKPTNVT